MLQLTKRMLPFALATTLASWPAAAADAVTVPMAKATSSGPGDSIGSITIQDTPTGLQFKLALVGLPPGPHGFHVHENGSCLPTLTAGVRIAAGAAGAHWDPEFTGKHLGPEGSGHKGDLPLIDVANNGTANQTLAVPRLKSLEALRGRSLVIHVRGDNYSDQPDPLGGGGLRLACGVTPK